MLRSILIGLAVLAASATAVAAQEPCKLGKVAELPVRMEGQRPLVTVEINGQPTSLIMDSGAFFSSINGVTAEKLGLKIGELPSYINVRGAGGMASYKLGRARTFKFAEANFTNVDILVGGPSAGMADGLLGQNVLGKLDVEYDFANGVVRLFKVDGCKTRNLAYWGAGKAVESVKLNATSVSEPHYRAKAQVNGRDVTVLFDTGAPVSILKRSAAVRVGFDPADPRVRSAGIMRGVGRNGYEAWAAPFESFALGGEEIRNTRLLVADMQTSEDMLLGADFFLSHRVYVSAAQDRMYFTHNGGPVFRLRDGGQIAERDLEELSDAGAYSRRAAASMSRFDLVRAGEDLDKAISLAPQDPAHYYDRAMVHVRSRRYEAAVTDLEQALKLRPGHVPSLIARGQSYLARNDLAAAKADFDEVRRLAPDDYDNRLQIASAYTAAGQFAPAIAEFDVWIAAHPRDPHLSTFLNARCWTRGLANIELDKALDDCNAAIRLSRDSNVLDSRALIYLRKGEYERAVTEYDDSIKRQPKSAWSHYGRGIAKQRLGRADEGQTDIAAAITMDPTLPMQAARYGLQAAP